MAIKLTLLKSGELLISDAKEIATNEKHLSLKNSSKIKVVFMDSGPNNYGQRINLLDKTIDYLKNDKNIEFLYKPHTRNNKKHYRNSSISIANEINSINLIKWADIIIGSTSSIMINVLQLKKIFILPSYLLDKNYKIINETNEQLLLSQ